MGDDPLWGRRAAVHPGVAFVDPGYTGEAARVAEAKGIKLWVVKVAGAERGFVLLL